MKQKLFGLGAKMQRDLHQPKLQHLELHFTRLTKREIECVYLAGEYQTQKDGYSELTVTEEDDVKKIWVSWMLEKEPANDLV